MPPTVRAFQHIFTTPALIEKIFKLFRRKNMQRQKKTRVKGMDLWYILVLAVISRFSIGRVIGSNPIQVTKVDKSKFDSVCPFLFSLKPSPSLYISSTASLSRVVQ